MPTECCTAPENGRILSSTNFKMFLLPKSVFYSFYQTRDNNNSYTLL